MTTVHIPETIEEATKRLGAIDTLLTAAGWERAAIVYAFAVDGEHLTKEDKLSHSINGKRTFTEFAALNIHGLTHAKTVSRHHHNWKSAVEDGLAREVNPGDHVVLPTMEYERVKQTVFTDGLTSPETPAWRKKLIIDEVMRREPEVATMVEDAFVRKVATDPILAHRVDMAARERLVTPLETRYPATATSALGLGSAIAGYVKLCRSQCDELVEYVNRRERDGDAEIAAIAQGEIDAMDRAKTTIDGYQDDIRGALGVDVDTTFERLMGRG